MKRRRDRFRVAGDAQLGLAWYTRETWAHLREVADDAQALDGSFEEWERGTLAAIRDLESVGLADVLGWLAACMTHEEILSDYIRACLSYAADRKCGVLIAA